MMREIKGDLCHEQLVKRMKQALAFDENRNYNEWKATVKEKLIELLGMREIQKNACPLNMEIESEEQKDGYKQIRFTFESEKDCFVPCYLLIPDTGKEKYPVAIVLQGHYNGGVYGSLGEIRNEHDKSYQPRGAFAVQAVKQGYIALAIEQRAMGERKTRHHPFDPFGCTHSTMMAFELGRTTIGERVWDAQRAIDLLFNFPQADTEKIAVTGNSGGGTASYYIACLEERVKLAVPSCAFCSYETSILRMHHCPCNYVPSIYKWFEMQDLACLIAPRKLAIVAGKEDGIFPMSGVKTGFETVQKIYAKENAAENCRLVETPKGHWWCEDIVWDTIKEESEKLGW
ncbi:MAG: acetylxylan esterase [Clostridia bacterium]|nr:acetylxylan esterase [Clostridia bacterium]